MSGENSPHIYRGEKAGKTHQQNAIFLSSPYGLFVEHNGHDRVRRLGEVCALGVDAAGKDAGHWESLRQLWAAYFLMAGANLRINSLLRELPTL
jgi:hypothetical protein